MTVFEATLWALGSIFALTTLFQGGFELVPSLRYDHAWFALCQVVAYLALLLVMHRLYFPKTRPSVIFGTRAGRWVFYPIAALLGIAFHLPADGLYEAILARWPDTAPAGEIFRGFSELPTWRKVAVGVGLIVTTPLIEEAFFRGALFGTLRRRLTAIPVVLCTATLFAYIHRQPQLFLPLGMVGAALAFLRVASGSIWPGVLLHMTFNGVTFYAFVEGAGNEPEGAQEMIPAWLVVTGTAVTGGLLALTDFLRTRKAETGPRMEEEES